MDNGGHPNVKHLLNLPESVVDTRLREICSDFDAKVYPKVRVADVLAVENSDISSEHFSYALKAHFDFVVTEADNKPIFAVEFDGPGHSTLDARRRDNLKNQLCDIFEFPLIRANRKYLPKSFSNWDLLSWFCIVWFVNRGWYEAVEAGNIPYEDSIFDPEFVSVRTKSGARGLELERNSRAYFMNMFVAGKLSNYVPNFVIASEANSTLRAIAWIRLSGDLGVYVETAMQHQRVGNLAQFAIRGIALEYLRVALGETLEGTRKPRLVSELQEEERDFRSKYQLLMACGSSANDA